ncbi:MAG: type II toxin-antitoxin system HicB family antitoxin [bacterium]
MRRKKITAGKKEFLVVIERGEDGYFIGSVPEIHGCHTQGRTLDELMKNIREVILLCLEATGDNPPETADFMGVQRIKV